MKFEISNLNSPPRLRDRLFPVLTVHVAVLFVVGAWYAARHVGTMNAARTIGALMTAQMGAMPPSNLGGRPSLLGALMSAPPLTPEQREAHEQLTRQIAAVEVIVLVWERGMWVVAALLDLLVLAGVLTGRTRGFHLAAAVVILLATATTLAAMRLLMMPAWGGMPPLATLSYVLVGSAQGAYALVLLLAFRHRRETLPPPVATG